MFVRLGRARCCTLDVGTDAGVDAVRHEARLAHADRIQAGRRLASLDRIRSSRSTDLPFGCNSLVVSYRIVLCCVGWHIGARTQIEEQLHDRVFQCLRVRLRRFSLSRFFLNFASAVIRDDSFVVVLMAAVFELRTICADRATVTKCDNIDVLGIVLTRYAATGEQSSLSTTSSTTTTTTATTTTSRKRRRVAANDDDDEYRRNCRDFEDHCSSILVCV